jgi:hypothetical protein
MVAGSDGTPPTVTKFERFNPAQEINSAPVLIFHATFSEPVNPATVDPTDFIVGGGSTALVTFVQEVAGFNDTVFEVQVSGGNIMSFTGTIGLNVSPGANIQDVAGNVLASSEPPIDQIYTRTGSSSLSLTGVGNGVTWKKKEPAVHVLPQIVVDGPALPGGTLVISIDASTKKSPFGKTTTKALGLAEKPVLSNGKLILQLHLGPSASASLIQAYLRSLTFAGKGKIASTTIRNLQVTLINSLGQSAVANQTITWQV